MRKTCRVPRKIPGCRWQACSNTFIQSFTTRIIPFITKAITFLTTILLCTIKFSDGFSNVSTLAGDWVTMKFCLEGELAQAAFVCLKRTLLWLVLHGFSWVSPSKRRSSKWLFTIIVIYCLTVTNWGLAIKIILKYVFFVVFWWGIRPIHYQIPPKEHSCFGGPYDPCGGIENDRGMGFFGIQCWKTLILMANFVVKVIGWRAWDGLEASLIVGPNSFRLPVICQDSVAENNNYISSFFPNIPNHHRIPADPGPGMKTGVCYPKILGR